MKFFKILPLLTLSFLLVACGSAEKKENEQLREQLSSVEITKENVVKLTSDWPEASKEAAKNMLNRYGVPDEVTASMLVWHDTGNFKRTTVYKDEITHLFPYQHADVLEQVVDYHVPKDKVAELWVFDGSVIPDRTKGELTSRSHKEELNILALNLVNEIIQGRLTASQARREYSHAARNLQNGQTSQYMTSLNFMQTTNTADPDRGLRAPKVQAEEESKTPKEE